MDDYKTIYQYGEVEQVIKHSRFIAYASPIKTYEEGKAFVNEIKAKNKDATHNVPALIVGNKQEVQWTSDDGEPQGTAGAPILSMLAERELTNLVVVVTRYFGGTKLGTGGLVRAYSGSAALVLEETGICISKESIVYKFEIEYPHLAKIQKLAEAGDFVIDSIEYTDKVLLTCTLAKENDDKIMTSFKDVTAGKAKIIEAKNGEIKVKIG